MAMNISGAGDFMRENVENDGCCITFVNIVPVSPKVFTLYGLEGMIAGHRYPKNPIVTKIPMTPKIDVGANAASDGNRQRGKTILPVINNIDACLDCKKSDISKDDDVVAVAIG
jgi:hypothetical protein